MALPYFEYDNKRIHYEEYGTGRPLLLLNDIMMSTESWSDYVGALSAQNRLILMDFLDQGMSDHASDPYEQSIQAEIVCTLLDHLGLKKINIAGYSYGGKIALQFALFYPRRLERLMLLNTPAWNSPWLRDVENAWYRAGGDSDTFYLAAIPTMYDPTFYAEKHEWVEQWRSILRPLFRDSAFLEGVVRLADSGVGYDVRSEIHNIVAPTLVVSSEGDYLIPMNEQRFLTTQIPGCLHIIIPNCGHAAIHEQPTLITTLMLGFTNSTQIFYEIV